MVVFYKAPLFKRQSRTWRRDMKGLAVSCVICLGVVPACNFVQFGFQYPRSDLPGTIPIEAFLSIGLKPVFDPGGLYVEVEQKMLDLHDVSHGVESDGRVTA